MSHELPLVEISRQPIELCKLLKIANWVSGGGEAKIVISEGYVLLNNEVEFQKRKKIYHNDIVEFNGEVIQVSCPYKNSSVGSTSKEKKANKNNKSQKIKEKSLPLNKQQAEYPTNIEPVPTAKRRPISF